MIFGVTVNIYHGACVCSMSGSALGLLCEKRREEKWMNVPFDQLPDELWRPTRQSPLQDSCNNRTDKD